MKYLRQLLLILLISFIGEILKCLIPLPIPASIYGMVILFACLMTGIIKLEQVKEAGKYLIEIMPVMFIPAAAGIINQWSYSVLSYYSSDPYYSNICYRTSVTENY